MTATLELGESSASNTFQKAVADGDAAGVSRFLMKAVARHISEEDLGDAEAGSKMSREDFAEFAGQAFGGADGPDALVMDDMGDTLAGNGAGVDLSALERMMHPSDGEDANGGDGGGEAGSNGRGKNALKGAKSSMKMGLYFGAGGGNGGNGGGSGGGSGRGLNGGGGRGREISTQTGMSGDGYGRGSGSGRGLYGGGSGRGLNGGNNGNDGNGGGGNGQGGYGNGSGGNDNGSGARGGGNNGDNGENGNDGGDYGAGGGGGAGGDGHDGNAEHDHRASMLGGGVRAVGHAGHMLHHLTAGELAARARAHEARQIELLEQQNKSLRFINKALALPPGKQPKTKASNRGLIVRQINQMFEDKCIADEIDDKDGNARTSLPEFVHEYFIGKYGLKKLAEKNFRELIYAVKLHTKPGKNFDERIALFSTLSGMTDMLEFATDASCVVLGLIDCLLPNKKQISKVLGRDLFFDFDKVIDAVDKIFQKHGIHIRQEMIIAVVSTSAPGRDVLSCWKLSDRLLVPIDG